MIGLVTDLVRAMRRRAGRRRRRRQLPAAELPGRSVELFFPVWEDDRDALLRRAFAGSELAGMDRIGFDDVGVTEDALWVAVQLPEAEAARYEDPASDYLGYRSVVLPRDVLNAMRWRDVPPAEVAARAGR